MNGISSHCGEERVACKPAQYLGALGLFEGLLGENSGAGKGCPNKGGAPIKGVPQYPQIMNQLTG